jgi:transposase
MGLAPKRARRSTPATPSVSKSRSAKPLPRGKGFTHWNNPSRVRAAASLAAKERKRSNNQARLKGFLDELGPRAAPGTVSPSGKGEGLSAVERARARAAAEEGMVLGQVAAAAGRSEAAIVRLHARQRRKARFLAAGGTPAEWRLKLRGGRPLALSPEDDARVVEAFERDPFASSGAIRATLNEQGAEFTRRSWPRVLRRLRILKRGVSLYEEFDKALLHMHYGWCEAMKRYVRAGGGLKRALRTLAFMDQSPLRYGAGNKSAYGRARIFSSYKSKDGKKDGNIWACIMFGKVIRVWVTDKNGDDDTVYEWFHSATPPPGWLHVHGEDGLLVDLLAAEGKRLGRPVILVADRLGRAGSTLYNVSCHYSPRVKAMFHRKGVGYILLCPKGAEENPIELFFAFIKQLMYDMRPDGGPLNKRGQVVRGPRTGAEAFLFLKRAVERVKSESGFLRAAFYKRALGKDFQRRYLKHPEAMAVREERAAPGFQASFSLTEVAFAPRLEAPGVSGYPHNAHAAFMYSRYFYHQEAAGTAAGLPIPFERLPHDIGGHERLCRLCAVDCSDKEKDPGGDFHEDLLECEQEGCAGTFHWHCLHLAKHPEDARFVCPGCLERGGPLQLRVYVSPARQLKLGENWASLSPAEQREPPRAVRKRKAQRRAAPSSDSEPDLSDSS